MDQKFFKKIWRAVKDKIFADKRLTYSVLAIVLLLLVYVFFARDYIKKQEEEKVIREEQARQEADQAKKEEKLKDVQFSRISFFLTNPIRASLAIPSYLEGNYRMRQAGKKTEFLYIKNPDVVHPLFYVRYMDKGEPLAEGEKKLGEAKSKKDSKIYVFAYYMYPEDSYPGEEKEDYKEALWDIKNIIIGSLKTF